MRKFILTAAMVLISASAQAGVSRSLTMAANDEPAVAGQPKTAEAPKAETPKFVERPAAVEPTADQPKADLTKADLTKADLSKSDQARPASGRKAEKPKPKHAATEARVIYELHRHGIYW